MKVRLPGINTVKAKGSTYYYFRKNGEPIKGEPGTDAFLASYNAAKAKADAEQPKPEPAKVGTLDAVIKAYKVSPEFTELAPATRDDYNDVFDYIQPIADMPARDITQAFTIKLRDKAFKKHKRRFANYVVQVVRLVLEWAIPRAYGLTVNPAAGVPLIKRPKTMGRANRPWTREEFRVIFAEAPKHLLRPLALGRFAGAREQSAINFPRSGFDGARVRWTANKNGRDVWLIASPELKRILKTAPKDSLSLCHNSYGRPWTQAGFRASLFKFLRKLREAGKIGKGVTFHGLRHTLGDELVDAGNDTRDIAAVLKVTEKTAELYSAGADDRLRADAAMKRVIKFRPRRK